MKTFGCPGSESGGDLGLRVECVSRFDGMPVGICGEIGISLINNSFEPTSKRDVGKAGFISQRPKAFGHDTVPAGLGRLGVSRERKDRAAANDNQGSAVKAAPIMARGGNPGREGRSRTDLALSDGGTGGKPRLTGRPGGQFGE